MLIVHLLLVHGCWGKGVSHKSSLFAVPPAVEMDVDVSETESETCSTYNGKCGGDKWKGSEDCCDEDATCFIKDGSYSQCRIDCPAGWDCETLPPTSLPTPRPTGEPTTQPSSSSPVCIRVCA